MTGSFKIAPKVYWTCRRLRPMLLLFFRLITYIWFLSVTKTFEIRVVRCGSFAIIHWRIICTTTRIILWFLKAFGTDASQNGIRLKRVLLCKDMRATSLAIRMMTIRSNCIGLLTYSLSAYASFWETKWFALPSILIFREYQHLVILNSGCKKRMGCSEIWVCQICDSG